MKNGAVALIVERDVNIEIPKIIVKDARYAMAVIASHFYGYPSNKMKLIGITVQMEKQLLPIYLKKF